MENTGAGSKSAGSVRHTTEQLEGVGGSNSAYPENATTNNVEYKVYKVRWFGLVVLMLQNIMISWAWITFAPISTSSKEFFKLRSETPVNWFSTVFFFAYVAVCPAVIYILHRHGVRLSVIIAGLLSIVGAWLRYAGAKIHSDNGGIFGLVMFGQILLGFAQPFVLNAPAHYADKWFTSRGRVSANALISLSNPLGAALGQLINPFIVTKASDIPTLLLILAAVTTVVALPNFFIKSSPPTPPCASSAHTKLSITQAIRIICRSKEFWFICYIFAVLVGFFNAASSLLNQILEPYGYTQDQAGIAGAVLIVAGLVVSAVVSPIIDRTHSFLLAIRTLVPLAAACFVALIFAPEARTLAPPYVVLGILGASSFSLLPMALELVVEFTHPVPPEITTSILWSGGQLLGAIFLIIMSALRDDKTGSMRKALIFEAVVACSTIPAAILFGFGTSRDKIQSRRVNEDKHGAIIEEYDQRT